METMTYIYLALTLVVLVLLLKIFGKNFFHRTFKPWMMNRVMTSIHTRIEEAKADVFTEAFRHYPKNSTLNILELGVGTGLNFKFYPENANVTILDKEDIFYDLLKKQFKKANRHDLKLSELVVSGAEDMRSIKTNSMDAIVHTFILCSVADQVKVLQECYRVLKPNGVCIFFEHSLDRLDTKRRVVQRFVEITPLCDCKFLEMDKLIRTHAKYEQIDIRRHKTLGSFMFYFTYPVFYGLGYKKPQQQQQE